MADRLEEALGRSVADSTDFVWIETASAALAPGEPLHARHSSSLEARVNVQGRSASHRVAGGSAADLEHALRQAMADARSAPKASTPRARLNGDLEPLSNRDLYDRRVARLTPASAERMLSEVDGDDFRAELCWSEARIAIVSSRGPTRRASVTAINLSVSVGEAPGAALARGTSRGLAGIHPEALVERARQKLRDMSGTAHLPDEPRQIVLSPEAAADLLALFGTVALSTTAWNGDPVPDLHQRLGQPWLSTRIRIDDDGGSTDGLPFPFDFAGNPKRRLTLVDAGIFRTPAVGHSLAGELGLPPTPHFEALDESRPRHLFLRGSGTHEADPLGTAPDHAVWIDRLEAPRATVPGTTAFRAEAYGLREIVDGRLGAALPPALWEDDLTRIFGSIAATGAKAALSPSPDGPWGAASSPAIGISTGGRLTALT